MKLEHSQITFLPEPDTKSSQAMEQTAYEYKGGMEKMSRDLALLKEKNYRIVRKQTYELIIKTKRIAMQHEHLFYCLCISYYLHEIFFFNIPYIR